MREPVGCNREMPKSLRRPTVGLTALGVAVATAFLVGRMTRPTSGQPELAPLAQATVAHTAIPVAKLPGPVRLPGLRPAPKSHAAAGTNAATQAATTGNGSQSGTATSGASTVVPTVEGPPTRTTPRKSTRKAGPTEEVE